MRSVLTYRTDTAVTFVTIQFISVFIAFAIYQTIIGTMCKTCETFFSMCSNRRKQGITNEIEQMKRQQSFNVYTSPISPSFDPFSFVKWENQQKQATFVRNGSSSSSSSKQIGLKLPVFLYDWPNVLQYHTSQTRERRNHVFI